MRAYVINLRCLGLAFGLIWLGSLIPLLTRSDGDPARLSRPKKGPESVTASPENVDVGEVSFGTSAKCAVAFRNNTTQDLRLDRLETTCGWTTTSSKPDSIPAGGAIKLEVQVANNRIANIGAFLNAVHLVYRNLRTNESGMVIVYISGVYQPQSSQK